MSAKTPSPPPPPPPPAAPPKKANEGVRKARDDQKKRAAGMSGDRSTLMTGPRGLMAPANTATPTLLGG